MKYALTNAFPAQPMQDKFGQIVFPTAGLSKLEYYSLELYKTYCSISGLRLGSFEAKEIMNLSIHDATQLITLLEEKTKNLQDEQNNTMAILQP